ncbi:hypothetical protein SCALIN_C05_0231 [Candidatus Scalindua japonica]|uniref:eCIS core domain-containing protein n=1 Tax=Candidatus Scalindua japonica TaxID=1284222 RepID=A0A286TW83_9BACT|nr:DUF4157 domain-containing protein [Candidatus Scalindua japonica]GAX60146.1 hypothetical protein SCALIN_C05_0231 [Candidatus Scalindua japonica]
MSNQTFAKPKTKNSTTSSSLFGKKTDRSFTIESANEIHDVPNTRFGHNFGNVRMEGGHSSTPFTLPGIQTKLKIGKPGDKYEQEADRVADQVMRMQDNTAISSQRSAVRKGGELIQTKPLSQEVQRKCKECEEEEEEIQRKPLVSKITPLIQRQTEEEEEEEEDKELLQTKPISNQIAPLIQRQAEEEEDEESGQIQTKPISEGITSLIQHQEVEEPDEEGEGPEIMTKSSVHSQAASSNLQSQLNVSKGSGSPLTEDIRTSMETFFGVDFSGVRVHTNSNAVQMNQGLNAKALTYGSNIYFNLGEYSPRSSTGKKLLAHELTHVIQQNKLSHAKVSHNEESIQMFAPYWEPKDFNGNKNHSLLLPLISKELKIFSEAPVPNASKTNIGHGKKGSADMYDASTTVGVYFLKHGVPKKLKAQRGKRVLKDEGHFNHDNNAAPQVDSLQNLTKIPDAPKSIVVGDLKPSHGTIEALEGTEQLENYIGGFELAAKDVNDISTTDKWKLIKPTKLSTAVPSGMSEPNSPVESQPIVLKIKGKTIRPNVISTGRVYVNKDPGNPGIWNYTWKPDKEFTDPLPESVKDLGDEVEEKVRKPVFISPLDNHQLSGKFKSQYPFTGNKIQRIKKRTPDKKLPNKDWFDFSKWRKGPYRKYKDKFKSAQKTTEFKTAEQQELALQDQKARVKSGFKSKFSKSQELFVKKFNQLKFWTSKKALIFGRFRDVFGTLFVNIAKVYNRVKSRFQNRLNQVKKPEGGGIAGAAITSAFRLIKIAGTVIINETISRLKESFTKGLTKKLKSLIPAGGFGELQKKADELNMQINSIKQKATQKIDRIVKDIIEPYQEIIDKIKTAANTLGKIKKIINLVKWGARAIACTTSPPVVGCIITPAIEYLASKVVQSCWFMKKIAPHIQGIPILGTLSLELAKIIKEKIQGFLPKPVKDVFAKIDEKVEFEKSDIKCPKGGDGGQLTPQQQALLDLQERIGEDKFKALVEMIKKLGLPENAPMPLDKIEEMGDLLEESDVDASDIKKFTNQNAEQQEKAKKELVKLKAVLDAINENATKPRSGSTSQQKSTQSSGQSSTTSTKNDLVQRLKNGEFDERFKKLIKARRLKRNGFFINDLDKLKKGDVVNGRKVLGLGNKKSQKRVGLVYFEVQKLVRQRKKIKDQLTIKFTRDLKLYDENGNEFIIAKANSTMKITLEFKIKAQSIN